MRIPVYLAAGILFYCFVPLDLSPPRGRMQAKCPILPPLPACSLLDPIERSSEVLFGLIMVLTFTGSFRVAGADQDDVNRILLAPLGCNLAWGIIDAVMYLLAELSQRGHNLQFVREVRAADPEKGRSLINDAMSPDLAKVLTEAEIEAIRQRFTQ